MRLLYTGSAPTAFVALGAELFPGDVFEVPDEAADAFLTRADVSPATPVARPRKTKTVDAVSPEPTTVTEEVDDAVSHGH